MLKYSGNTINDWNYGTSNLIKVYRNNAIVFYKVNGESPTPEYKVCFAVVDDISQYSETEFEDVYDKATEKWYKLNNLNEYEEYGIYGSGRTSCEGSTSRLPQGYTEVEYIENTSTAYIDTGVYLYDTTANSYEIETKMSSTWGGGEFEYLLATEGTSSPYNGFELRWNTHYQSGGELQCESVPKNVTYSNVDNGDGTSAITISCTSTNATNNVPLSLFCGIWSTGPWRNGRGKIYSFKVTKNNTLVKDLVPCKMDSDDKYGLYDLITDTFYTSPNGNNFIGGEPITPTDCVTTYNGKLTIDDGYEYEWNGSSWVNVGEVSGSTATLPDVPFVLNYNAKNYDATTHTIAMTNGQLNDTDAVAYNNPSNIVDHSSDGYITISNSSMQIRKSGQDISLFNRTDTSTGSSITIVCKAKSTSGENIITNRDGNYNWMYRLKTGGTLRFHGTTETGSISWNRYNPDIMSVRTYYDSGTKLYYNNWTQNTSTSPISFTYGSTNGDSSNAGALFVGYSWSNTNEQWSGDFYWVYMSQNTLTDSQIQQVIDYNEEGGGQSEYPLYYDEKADPLNYLTFNSMEDAQDYAYNNCVYNGMQATIDGVKYIFSGDSQSGYEWIENPSRLPQGYTEVEYIENQNQAYINTLFKPNQDTRIIAEMQCVTSTNSVMHFGAGGWDRTDGMWLTYETGINGTLHIAWLGKTTWTTYGNGDYNKHTYDWNKNELYKDDVFVGSSAYGTYQCLNNLAIFANLQGEGNEYVGGIYMNGKMFSFKIYDNGTLVRDFIPCIDPNNIVGAYDIVNGQFYTSASSYQFVAGPLV